MFFVFSRNFWNLNILINMLYGKDIAFIKISSIYRRKSYRFAREQINSEGTGELHF